MKGNSFIPVKKLYSAQFWLLVILCCLTAIHITLAKSVNISFQGLSIICWLSGGVLCWEKRHQLILDSDIVSSFIGLSLISIVLFKSSVSPTSNFLQVSPFVSIIGVGLLASGFQGLKQYWRELLILFFLGVPKTLIWPVFDISGITAQFSTLLLIYAGFDAYRQGFQVMLPSGGVNVNMGCSGFESMFYLLSLAILFLVMFPLKGIIKNVLVLTMSVCLAFIVNGTRVALMVILDATHNREALHYWHVGQGSQIFSMISVALFGLFCFWMEQQQKITNHITDER